MAAAGGDRRTIARHGAGWEGHRDHWWSGWDRALRRLPIQRTRADWPEFGTVEHSGFDSGPLLVATREDGGAVALTNNGNTPAEDYVEVVMPAGWRRVRLAQGDPFGGALSPDGRWAVTGSFSEPGARLWSLPDGQLRLLPGMKAEPRNQSGAPPG